MNFKNNGKSIESKTSILKFAQAYDKLPSRNSNNRKEVLLAQKMENYLSPKNLCYDESFRELVYEMFPRKVNSKRSHDKESRIKELKEFIFKFKRLPRTSNSVTIKPSRKELLVRSVLDNYASQTSEHFDENVRNFILSIDPEYGNQNLPISKRKTNLD